jgi:Fe-S cluster assembly protein SufD
MAIILPIQEAWSIYGLLLKQYKADAQETGLFVYVPPGCVHELQLSSTPRMYLFLGKGASLALKEQGTGGNCDIYLEEDAVLTITDRTDGPRAMRATLARAARLTATSYARASVRHQHHIVLQGEEASAELRGLYDLTNQQESFIQILMEHRAPHCRSRQHFKFVLQDRSRSSFEGKIYVHQAAQKTESYQLVQNLLLSDEVSAAAKPNLEIFADDVKASHGATFTQLQPEELFYFRSRGLSEQEAKELLRKGFCQEILNFL